MLAPRGWQLSPPFAGLAQYALGPTGWWQQGVGRTDPRPQALLEVCFFTPLCTLKKHLQSVFLYYVGASIGATAQPARPTTVRNVNSRAGPPSPAREQITAKVDVRP